MNKTYFCPEIEDLHIGYEYEKYSIGLQMINNVFLSKEDRDDELKWRSCIIKSYLDMLDLATSSYNNINNPEPFKLYWKDFIRVPYLTDKQIIAEGWKPEKNYFKKNNLYLFFENNYLEIDFGEPFTWDAGDSDIRYKGQCKDINTFRKIIKLLEIN